MQELNNFNETAEKLVILPEYKYREITEKLNALLHAVSIPTEHSVRLPEWLTEKETQRLLGKKTTALWKLRNEGKILFSKIGGSTFYSLTSIKKFLEKNIK